MAEIYVSLEKEYCPPLDAALLSAILSDYDLDSPDDVKQARSTLDELKSSASEEEASGFDASGSGGALTVSTAEVTENVSSQLQNGAPMSEVTGGTSLSEGLSSLSMDSGSGKSSEEETKPLPEMDEVEQQSPEVKEAMLFDMFPTIPKHNISYILQKCGFKYTRAVEELLNRVWFDEADAGGECQTRAKGIDAFMGDGPLSPVRQRKGRKNRKLKSLDDEKQAGLLTPMSAENSPPQSNAWQKANTDVDFINARVCLPKITVSSIYHKNGASLPATIAALTAPEHLIDVSPASQDPTIIAHAQELLADFPSLTLPQSTGLIRLTHPSTAAAHELAQALTRPPSTGTSAPSAIQLIPQYQPYSPTSTNDDATTNNNKPAGSATIPSASAQPSTSTSTHAALNHALTSASRAHRLGRSDPLMRAAASIYTHRASSLSAQAAAADARAADALVASQSPRPSEEIDLHGCGVRDAMRIALASTARWWETLGERGIGAEGWRREGVGGFRVVTGVGRHSEGGRARLGPAVGRALVGEGWRVEMGSGVVVVKGRVRR
ncbi:MAG: hypothetical protein M1821_004074 [Bathelium mastoideum]|nr:MAG: hypothetical protein M1821_004074 [Bathelium mastoideum]